MFDDINQCQTFGIENKKIGINEKEFKKLIEKVYTIVTQYEEIIEIKNEYGYNY